MPLDTVMLTATLLFIEYAHETTVRADEAREQLACSQLAPFQANPRGVGALLTGFPGLAGVHDSQRGTLSETGILQFSSKSHPLLMRYLPLSLPPHNQLVAKFSTLIAR